MDPTLAHPAVPGDFPEERTGDDLGCFEPLAQRGNRTGGGMCSPGEGNLPSLPGLIGLRSAQGEYGSFGNPGKIFDRKGGELGPAQSAGIADQQKRPVADPGETGGEVGQHLNEVGGEERGLARLGGSERTPDPLERFGDDSVLGGGWIGMAGGGVRLGDRSQTPGECGGPVGLGERDQVEGHGLGRGRQERNWTSVAPGNEVLPVRAVGPESGRSLRGPQKGRAWAWSRSSASAVSGTVPLPANSWASTGLPALLLVHLTLHVGACGVPPAEAILPP